MSAKRGGRRFLGWLGLWCLCLATPSTLGLEIGDLHHQLIREPATFFVDREQLSLDQVKQRDFRPLQSANVNQGISDATFWLHFRLNNSGHRSETWVLQHETSYLDRMVVHVRDTGESNYRRIPLSDRAPFEARPVPYSKLGYRHTTPPGGTTDVYLKLWFDKADSMSLNVHLWSESAFLKHVQRQHLIYGAFYGIFLLLILMALITAVTFRQASAWVYALFLTVTTVFWLLLNGIGFQYLWPDFVYWQNEGFHLVYLAFTFVGIQFSKLFLKTRELLPGTHRLFTLIQALAVLGVVLRLAGLYEPVLHLAFGLLTALALVLPVTGWRAWRRGTTSARWYTYAWCAYSAGLLLNLTSAYTTWLPWGMGAISWLQAGSLIEALLLMIAMSERLLTLDRDRRRALTLANIDPLTGLGNRRLLQWHYGRLEAAFARDRTPVFLILIDLDHFKTINDTFGHEAGDRVLKHMAGILTAVCRESDVCIRYGGEEFAILLQARDMQQAFAVTERIRRTFANSPTLAGEQWIEHSLSAGIARVIAAEQVLGSARGLARADIALYRAKLAGRNRTFMYHPDDEDTDPGYTAFSVSPGE